MIKRLLLSICILVSANSAFAARTVNEKPFVIPELKEWRGGNGVFAPGPDSRIVCKTEDPALMQVAEMLSDDMFKMFGVKLATATGKAREGDIALGIKADKKLGAEGYEMNIGVRAELSAPTVTGVYWATRTLLQMGEQRKAGESFSILQGSVRDWPDYEIRGFMIDCGRKFIPMDFLQDYVDIMSYYKMNFLQIHLNDSGFPKFFEYDWDKTYAAFRLESETFPGLAAEDGHYKKAEFRDFQKRAASRFVEIMPEIDVPAHTLAFVHYKPELGSAVYGSDHFDLFNEETYRFTDALFAEYLGGEDPVFCGPRVSIGTDEYSNKDPEVVEKFRYFTDRYIRYAESFGKQACVWGSLTHARGETPVKVENVLMQSWSKDYSEPREMAALGYRLVSIPDSQVYIVPAAGYYYDYLNIEYLYEKWTPANINGTVFPELDPAIAGGMFAVWNDHVGNGISTRDIHHRAFPALQTISSKCWTGASVSLSFEEFDSRRRLLSEAPDVNLLGRRVPDNGSGDYVTFWTAGELEPDSEYPFEDVGYEYMIEFDIECADEKPGTELFRSGDAVFYLSDPISGMLGFARDGYLNTFRYRVDAGEKMHIGIGGDNRSTRLYIDGKLVHELSVGKKWYGEKAATNYVPTLVFPLRHTGAFRSRITNFEARQK